MSITLDTVVYDGKQWGPTPDNYEGATRVLYRAGCRQNERYHPKYDKQLVLDAPGIHDSVTAGQTVALYEGKVIMVLDDVAETKPPKVRKPKPKATAKAA
jgi:hypothetical protein